MVAMQLWAITEETAYLEFAQRTWHTGLGHAQRGNGGFGCDTVTGAPESKSVDSLKVLMEEAWFCCSMRAAEGFYAAVRWSVVEKDGRLLLPLLNSGQVEWRGWVLEVDSAWPWEGRITVTVKQAGQGPLPLSVFVPSWARHESAGRFHNVDLTLAIGQSWSLEFPQQPRVETPHNQTTDSEYFSIWQGPVQFGALDLEQKPKPEAGLSFHPEQRVVTSCACCLTPVNDFRTRSADAYERRVLFTTR